MKIEKFNCSEDYFKSISGSKIWPSNDPNDSPFDEFICKVCGWGFSARMNESFPINYDPMSDVLIKMKDHVYLAHK